MGPELPVSGLDGINESSVNVFMGFHGFTWIFAGLLGHSEWTRGRFETFHACFLPVFTSFKQVKSYKMAA